MIDTETAIIGGAGLTASGILIGLIPKFVEAYKAYKGEGREDRKDTIEEYSRLLEAIRAEREEIRRENAAIREAHDECIKKAAAQEERINGLKHIVDRLRKRVELLEQEKRNRNDT